MDRLNDVRPSDDQVVIASLERLSAEIVGREVEALYAGPHRAVVHEDSGFKSFEIGRIDFVTGHAGYLYEKGPARMRRAGSALAEYLTWPQVAINRHESSTYDGLYRMRLPRSIPA